MAIIDDNFFKTRYPQNYPAFEGIGDENSILDIFNRACQQYPERPAFMCLDHAISYRELDAKAAAFAAYLQHNTDLKTGDRIAIMLPNILQFPVALFGAMRAGLVVVNTNPLYTEREMQHQFNDAGVKALVVLANMAARVSNVLANTSIETVIVTEIADLHPPMKRLLINSVVKFVKKQVPAYHIGNAIPWLRALDIGSRQQFNTPPNDKHDVAVLQYTGGTTGLSKGAMLSHYNLIANMYQANALMSQALAGAKSRQVITPLPLYHIYAFTVHLTSMLSIGYCNVLIPNPRDIPAFIKTLKKCQMAGFIGLNTLFVALANHPEFANEVDFSALKFTCSGGMALSSAAAKLWQEVTGCPITEGYGLTETSPIVCLNLFNHNRLGSIGQPLYETLCKIIDEDGNELPIGEVGELCVKGPQVMLGYWQKPEETAKVLDSDGWFKTGDIATISEDGYVSIVDRKKDMIIVSGFNVYPNEIEDHITTHPAIIEAAAVGVADEITGEKIKLFVVTKESLSADEVIAYAKKGLTAYKVPKMIEFVQELPKSNVGKILRRELRDKA